MAVLSENEEKRDYNQHDFEGERRTEDENLHYMRSMMDLGWAMDM